MARAAARKEKFDEKGNLMLHVPAIDDEHGAGTDGTAPPGSDLTMSSAALCTEKSTAA
ncbi:MAG TPA: hypothetical protein VF772_01540 [Terriglobales bacterium]